MQRRWTHRKSYTVVDSESVADTRNNTHGSNTLKTPLRDSVHNTTILVVIKVIITTFPK